MDPQRAAFFATLVISFAPFLLGRICMVSSTCSFCVEDIGNRLVGVSVTDVKKHKISRSGKFDEHKFYICMLALQ